MKKLIPLVIIAFAWLISYTLSKAPVLTPEFAFPWTPILFTEIFVGIVIVNWLIERKK